ncbi:iron-siderophore ABC transporter substrate-binding protein [Glycomyces sp. L485]|uniref:ABC transporter substrate-binding protein n=1 Tax=Glycomyces sp. L485 TaxID=2909235 RepID=UPI001F4B30C5|nr:iron-siderophore ABC transporter substrate-binding protein [Glycomyces sp. L485]MCH7232010.1 iron-siderophore ABC transporter substrate-binding protein [Glycomyces sp. L485]
MKRSQLTGLASAATGLALLLTACGSDADATDTDDAASSVTVEHAMGSTDVACTPQKVVTLGQGQTDTVLALGVTPVGVVSPWTDEWYEYLPDEVEDATVVGTEIEPDLETIATLQPDVILGSKLRHEALYDQLSQIAPTVFSETIGVAWKDNVPLWAEALCLEDEGAQILAEYEAHAQQVADGLAEAGLADTEASMIRFMPDQVRIYLTGFPGSVMRDAGLQRPAAQQVDDWENSEQLIEISEERIPEMDGDVVFVMVSEQWYSESGSQETEENMSKWTSTELWQQLSAVQNDQVHEVNESHWNLGGGIGAARAMLDDLGEYFLGQE